VQRSLIGIKPFLKDTVQKLYQEDSDFNYLEPGNAMNRVLITRLLKNYTLLSRKPNYNGQVQQNIKNASNRIDQVIFGCIVNSKKLYVQVASKFILKLGESTELIQDTYGQFTDSFPNIQFDVTGRGQKKAQLRVYVNIAYTDFDLEIEKLRKEVELFFEQIQEGFKNLV